MVSQNLLPLLRSVDTFEVEEEASDSKLLKVGEAGLYQIEMKSTLVTWGKYRSTVRGK